jgi:hypothetical protein
MRATPTVREPARSYIDAHAKLKKKTWKIDEAYLDQLLIPRFGAHLASSITRADIASIHTDIGKKHPYTANRFISIIRKTSVVIWAWSRRKSGIPAPRLCRLLRRSADDM